MGARYLSSLLLLLVSTACSDDSSPGDAAGGTSAGSAGSAGKAAAGAGGSGAGAGGLPAAGAGGQAAAGSAGHGGAPGTAGANQAGSSGGSGHGGAAGGAGQGTSGGSGQIGAGTSGGSGQSAAGQSGGAGSGSGSSGSGSSGSGSSGAGGSSVVNEPAWMKGKPLFSWFPIPNTEGSGGARVNDYSGFAVRAARSEVWIGLASGHAAGHDNRVVSLDLTLDQPTWLTRKPVSTQTSDNTAYYPDGTPAGRHTYQSIHWVESVNRLLFVGARFTYPNGNTFLTVDGFNPDTSAWDPQGTWMDIPQGSLVGIVRDGQDRIWTPDFAVFTPKTNSWQPPLGPTDTDAHFPAAFDSKRNQLVMVMVGDGQGYGDQKSVHASRLRLDGSAPEKITLQDGDALESILAPSAPATPSYNAAMDYDPINDRLYFYDGYNAPGVLHQLTPAESGPWPFTIVPLAEGSETPPASPNSGIQNRFQYVPALKGFVTLPGNSSALYFLRVG